MYGGNEVIRINTQEKVQEVVEEIKTVMMTDEDKDKIDKWNKQLLDSWNDIKK